MWLRKRQKNLTENASSEHPGTQNLVPVRTKEEARERGRKGGLKSAEVRRQKKTMRDMAKSIMETTVSEQMGNVRDTLARMGLEENDMTYQAAVVVRLIQKAMVEGDTSAIRVLGELTGELNRFGYIEADDPDVIELQYPAILIPENGRDEPKQNVLGPQAGPQTMFMASSADIVIYGGAAGGGKTYALLLEALRHKMSKGLVLLSSERISHRLPLRVVCGMPVPRYSRKCRMHTNERRRNSIGSSMPERS